MLSIYGSEPEYAYKRYAYKKYVVSDLLLIFKFWSPLCSHYLEGATIRTDSLFLRCIFQFLKIAEALTEKSSEKQLLIENQWSKFLENTCRDISF